MPGDRVPWEALGSFSLEPTATRRTLEALLRSTSFSDLSADDRGAVWLACLVGRIGKTRRISDRKARRLLWELGVPFVLREQVCGLVRYGWVPPVLVDRDDATRLALELSLSCRADLLAVVAEAEGEDLDDVALFRVFCAELGCLAAPWPFPSDHSRVTYFRWRSGPPELVAHDDTRAELVVTSGLPGAGKDTWVAANVPELPTVSLDDLRASLGVAPDADQGTVQQAGRDALRTHLRRGEPFVYLATNLDRQRRAPVLDLAADYGFRVRIVYIEVPIDTLFAQNRDREASVPEDVIARMTDRWEVPNLTEAHRLDLVVR